MSETPLLHTETHQQQVRELVEGNLSAEERRLVEQRLLSCLACLEEYNWYSKVWASLTNPDQFQRWGRQLAAREPTRHKVYRRAVELLPEAETTEAAHTLSASSGFWRSTPLWRNLCFGLAATLALMIPAAVYQLKKNTAANDRYLRTKVADAEDLKARVDKLSTERASQEAQMAELRRTLEHDRAPRPNAVLSIDFAATRRVEDRDVKSIKLPPDKTFLELRIKTVEQKNYKSYSMILRDQRGQPLWQSDAVTKDEEDTFSLTLGAGFLNPGYYEILIYGQQRRTRDLIAHLRFRIIAGP